MKIVAFIFGLILLFFCFFQIRKSFSEDDVKISDVKLQSVSYEIRLEDKVGSKAILLSASQSRKIDHLLKEERLKAQRDYLGYSVSSDGGAVHFYTSPLKTIGVIVKSGSDENSAEYYKSLIAWIDSDGYPLDILMDDIYSNESRLAFRSLVLGEIEKMQENE